MAAVESVRTGLDEVMPRWHFRERHQRRIDAPGVDVLDAIARTTWAEVPLFTVLLRIGSLGRLRREPGRTVFEDMVAGGFRLLVRTEEELVIAAVSGDEPFPPEDGGPGPADWFRGYAPLGSSKVAFNVRFTGGVLTTETRVVAADEDARRRFRRYWLMIRLPGGLVRREMLRTVRRAVGERK